MGILQAHKIEQFNPADATHVSAYSMVRAGKQHPHLRFHVAHPYVDVVTMMAHEIADYHCRRTLDG